jgi:hypothetical protein
MHVAWYSNGYQRKLPHDQWGLHYARRHPGADTFEPQRNLNHVPSDGYSLAVGPKGEVAVFWLREVLWTALSTDGGVTFQPPVKIAGTDTCECCATRAAFAPDGALFCAYRDKAANRRDMRLVVQSREGKFITKPLATTPWLINACPMTGCSLVPAGRQTIAAWQTNGTISFARLDGSGSIQPPGERVIPPKGGHYPIALTSSDGTVCVSWKDGQTLKWQFFSKDGKPLGHPESKSSSNPHRHAAVVSSGTFLLIDGALRETVPSR